jgi:vitamin B12 transporter
MRVWTELRVTGERFDFGTAGREALDPYGLVNLAVDYEVQRLLVLRARVDNLLDTAYEEVLGYGTAGISGYFGVTVRLQRR